MHYKETLFQVKRDPFSIRRCDLLKHLLNNGGSKIANKILDEISTMNNQILS
jgi:hypothetical protein